MLCQHPTNRLKRAEAGGSIWFCLDCGCDVAEGVFEMLAFLEGRLALAKTKLGDIKASLAALSTKLSTKAP